MTKLIDRLRHQLRDLRQRLFGTADDTVHDELLDAYIEHVPTGRALDIGMGEGDNAIWLARRGFQVVGIDRSTQAVEMASQRAHGAGLAMETQVGDVQDFEIRSGSYALILAAAVLHFLVPDDGRRLVDRIKTGLQPGGVVIVSVFTVDDPGYETLQEARAPLIGRNTFHVEHLDGPLHFFGMGELRDWFQDLEILHYAEERQMDLEGGLPHYHSGAFLVARRPDTP
jgi:2-polyprenyl-3-methyl-5-hydroxy-6-metoxy-1,4-benzoquinol methylase